MRHSIMTEKLARRGTSVRTACAVDYLSQVLVCDVRTREVASLAANAAVRGVRAWPAADRSDTSHQGFPVLGPGGRLVGVVTRRDIFRMDLEEPARVGELVRRAPRWSIPATPCARPRTTGSGSA